MITVAGKEIENCPEGVDNINELMLGELNSKIMRNLKTPVSVFGRNIPEVLEYAAKVKEADILYDIVYIYDAVDEDGIRDYLYEQRI